MLAVGVAEGGARRLLQQVLLRAEDGQQDGAEPAAHQAVEEEVCGVCQASLGLGMLLINGSRNVIII